jgi:hypothetical protein
MKEIEHTHHSMIFPLDASNEPFIRLWSLLTILLTHYIIILIAPLPPPPPSH